MRCASLSMNPVGEHRFCSSMEQKLTDRGTSAMKDQKTIDLFLYWNRLRNGRPSPRRHEIEPADIRSLLGDTFILEEDTRGQAIFRLAGTRLCALFGQELKGFVFASLWNDRDRRIVTRLAGNAFRDNCVVVLSLEGHSRAGRQIAMELVLLPLHGKGEGARALGSAVVLDKPFWLCVDPLVECRLNALRVVDPDREPVFLKNRPEVAVPSLSPAAEDMDYGRERPTGRRVRHLMVLDGGLS